MTDSNLAIMDGMPFDQWIAIDGDAQRIYKTFRERFHSDVECMVAHDGSFFVRDNNDGFHEVNGASDFDDYKAWCARCGVYLADEENWCYCDYSSCDNRVCAGCSEGWYSDVYCPEHEDIARLRDGKDPVYTYPYSRKGGFTFGVEIETKGELPGPLVKQIMDDDNPLVAGWSNDPSLSDGVEVQTNILTMEWLPPPPLRELDRYDVRHAVTGDSIWSGYEYMLVHRGVDVVHVIDNILLSRKARRSHGTPQPERLERTALRLLNHMGRPELNPQYVQIKEMLDN